MVDVEVKGEWQLVRHVPKGPKWHPAKDQLKGDVEYGKPYDKTNAWSIKFPDGFNEFKFATGDGYNWLIVDKHELLGTGNYSNTAK